MPSLDDMQLATPRCQRRQIVAHPGSRQGGWHTECLKPMRYITGNRWLCPDGHEEPGEQVAARRATTVTSVAA